MFSSPYDDRDRSCHPLISAARINDHRQLASAHTGITAGSRVCFDTCIQTVFVRRQKNAADVRTVISVQAFVGNCHIARNLTLYDFLYIFYMKIVGKLVNPFHAHEGAIALLF